MAQNEQRPFAVIVKPVGARCNMRCAYCYYLEKSELNAQGAQSRMSYATLERLIRQTVESSPGPVVSFTWHGGEPTLAGLDFYRRAVELERKYLPRGWQTWNNLQTNGLLLNDEWCAFLKNEHFDVGLSIDGCAAVHDKNRLDRGGSGTYERVKKAALRLTKAGLEPDLLCTVTSDSAAHPLEVYRGLKELQTGWVQFIPVVVPLPDGGFAPQSVTPEAYGEFLCKVFDEWATEDLGKLDVQLFAETARIWAGGEASVCHMAGECGRVLVCESDGSIYSCDHFVDDEHRLGSVNNAKLRSYADGEFQTAFGESKRTALTAQCRACPWLSCCGGGCLKDRFALSKDGEPGQYYLCAGLEKFFSHARGPMELAMELSRQGAENAEIMKQIKRFLEEKTP